VSAAERFATFAGEVVKTRQLNRLVVLLFGAAVLSLSGGCTILGVAASKLSGPTHVPPVYVLPKVPTLVLVDRPVNFGAVELDAQRISRDVTTALEQAKIAPMVDPGQAVDVRSRRTEDGRRLRPTEIAAACGAKQIIYVELGKLDSTTAVGGDAMDGKADATVWVVDVTTAHVLWPPEETRGFAVKAEVPFKPTAEGTSVQEVHAALDGMITERVSRLFTGYTEE
jgi:hypothetical protein